MPRLFATSIERCVVPDAAGVDDSGAGVNDQVSPGYKMDAGAVAAQRSLAVLGAPGAGKSWFLREALTERLGCSSGDVRHRRLYVPLGEIPDLNELRRRLCAAIATPLPSGARRVVVLDGLDECPISNADRAIAPVLNEILEGAADDGCDFWAGCRSADYPRTFTDRVAERLDGFRVFRLQPLDDPEVRGLVTGEGLDADAFVAAVRSAGAEALVGLPLSLHGLVENFRDTGSLDATPVELFRRTARLLLAEPDEDRRHSHLTATNLDQRLALAERSCFLMILSGKSGISTRPDHTADASTLDFDEVRSEPETVEGDGYVAATAESVLETLSTACFEARGPGRVGPVHASIGSFLAASYACRHDLPREQLRSLLVVDDPVAGTGIPTHLRELCAWLIALAPERNGWLTDLDPAGVMTVAAVIDDDQVANRLAEHLLSEPGAALRAHPYRSWRLRSRTLGDLLATTLAALGPPPHDTHVLDVVRVIAYLADDSHVVTMARPLAQAGCQPELPPRVRGRLIAIASRLDRPAAAGQIACLADDVLGSAVVETAEEVRGALAEALWPEQMSTARLLALVTPPRRPHSYDVYYMARDGLARNLPDHELPVLLAWITARLNEAGGSDADVNSEEMTDLVSLISGVIERMAESPDTPLHPDSVAGPAATVLGAHQKLTLPARFEQRAADEPAQVAALRRALAIAMFRALGSNRPAAYFLRRGWVPSWSRMLVRPAAHSSTVRASLVDEDDLPALASLALGGTSGLGPLLSWLFDYTRGEHHDAAWALQDTDAWAELRAWFDAWATDGEPARTARKDHEQTRERETRQRDRPTPPWFALADRDLTDGRNVADLVESMIRLHGASWVPDSGPDLLHIADKCRLVSVGVEQWIEGALAYLTQIDPISDDHLDDPGATTVDGLIAWLALDLLCRHDDGRHLGRLPEDRLAAWGACLLSAAPLHVEGAATPQTVLLRRLHAARPERLVELLTRSLDAQLAHTHPCSFLPALAVPELADLFNVLDPYLEAVLARAQTPPDAVTSPGVCSGPATAGPADGRVPEERGLTHLARHLTATLVCWRADVLDERIRPLLERAGRAEAGSLLVELAADVVAPLMAEGDPWWSRLQPATTASPALERAVLSGVAAHRAASALPGRLTSASLGTLWSRLAQLWLPQDDVQPLGAYEVTTDEQARDWRRRVLYELESRDDPDTVTVLRALNAARPDDRGIAAALAETQHRLRSRSWNPLTPAELRRVVRDRTTRVVHDSGDLLAVVVEALRELSHDLVQTGSSLWSYARDKGNRAGTRWPNDEPDITTRITTQLRQSLHDRSVVVNREVQVRPTTTRGHGRTVDIQAETITGTEPSTACQVLIEVKGNWHPDLHHALESQLVTEYLRRTGNRHGIYLVAWFPVEQWTDESDPRKKTARRRDRVETERQLKGQAEGLNDVHVEVVVLDCPFPSRELT